MERKYFGTDGIRGKVGSSTIHPEFMLKLGWAVGRVLGQGERRKILIGKDTRISGYMLESALEAGLSAAGIDVRLLGPMPTPAVAYLTKTLRATAGIVISASHNSYEDNGIKFFSSDGYKLPDQLELQIEMELEKPMQIVASPLLGKAARINDAPGRYIEYCKSSIPSLTRLTGLKIVVDCAHGATYHIAPSVFLELGAEVITLGNKPDGFNINYQVGSTSPESLRQMTLDHAADIGIGFDGDGDRVIMVDKAGRLVCGDQILYIIANDRHQRDLLRGGVVGTLMSNYGLERAFAAKSIPFLRTQVGDRYVLEALKEKNWRIGGESSGHIVCLDKTTTGDGIIAALQVLCVMSRQEKSLSELCEEITLFPQSLINIKTNNAISLANDKRVQAAVDRLNTSFDQSGRVLLRPSGTEPVLRVMVEGPDQQDVEGKARSLSEEIMNIASNLGHFQAV